MSSSLVLGDGLNHVRHFVDTIGKRITGSEGERRAAEYQCQRLQAWGCEDVRCEPFAARGWDFDVCRVNCDELGTVEALPIEFSASTPAGGTEAELVVCEKAADVAAEQIAGKIALFCGGLPEADVLLDSQPAGALEVVRSLSQLQLDGRSTS
jgi:hypothetical protein